MDKKKRCEILATSEKIDGVSGRNQLTEFLQSFSFFFSPLFCLSHFLSLFLLLFYALRCFNFVSRLFLVASRIRCKGLCACRERFRSALSNSVSRSYIYIFFFFDFSLSSVCVRHTVLFTGVALETACTYERNRNMEM